MVDYGVREVGTGASEQVNRTVNGTSLTTGSGACRDGRIMGAVSGVYNGWEVCRK